MALTLSKFNHNGQATLTNSKGQKFKVLLNGSWGIYKRDRCVIGTSCAVRHTPSEAQAKRELMRLLKHCEKTFVSISDGRSEVQLF